MQGKDQFDRMIADILQMQAKKIIVRQGAGERLKNTIIQTVLRKEMHYGNHNCWRKVVLLVVCFVLLSSSAMFSFSSGAQSWASETIDKVINKVQIIIGKNESDGHTEIKSESNITEGIAGGNISVRGKAEDRNNIGGVTFQGTGITLAEAEKQAGFKIKLPSYLPQDCVMPDRIMVGENIIKDGQGNFTETGNHLVIIWFIDAEDFFQGMKYTISQTAYDFRPGFAYSTIEVGNQDARLYETELFIKDAEGIEIKVVERVLIWEEDALTYMITDYNGHSEEELVKMAESIK